MLIFSANPCSLRYSTSILFEQGPTSLTTSAQLRAVDELSVQENTANRKGLANVTIELQIISKDINKFISDVDVASRNLTKTQEALAHFGQRYFNAPKRPCSQFPVPLFFCP